MYCVVLEQKQFIVKYCQEESQWMFLYCKHHVLTHFEIINVSYWIPWKSLIGTSAIETTGTTLELLPTVSESKFCLRRILRCFRAFLFVASNATRTTLSWIPLTTFRLSMVKMMFTTIVRAIEMFKVENGIALIMIGDGLVEAGCERREKRAIISDPIMKRAVSVLDVAWK